MGADYGATRNNLDMHYPHGGLRASEDRKYLWLPGRLGN